MTDKEIAIKVEGVSKTFVIPHEKVSTLKGAFVSALKSKRYEEFHALEEVSFEVKKGEFFGIIGRNGSGKSTLLKILAGIYKPDKGKIKINGRISPFLELGIGFNPELSGRDNIYLNATVLGLTHKQIDEKFDDIVEFSELRRFIDQKIKNYSSGMQVRLAFSVAIHANRDILLMDEVLAVGDVNFQKKCIEEFEKYKRLGKTVILVTHDILTVREYCDRAMLLNNGKIIIKGKSSAVVDKYIEENMTEEEIRIKEENEKNEYNREGKGVGTGKALIKKFEIYDHNQLKSSSLESGNRFKIKLIVRFFENVNNPVFGVMFKDNMGRNLLGIHSLYSRNPKIIKEAKKGEILEINFDLDMMLAPGTYNLWIACASQETHLKYELLDSREDIMKIRVYSSQTFWGAINSDITSNIKKIN